MAGAELATRRGNGLAVQHPDMDSMQVAQAFAASGMFPDIKDQAQALVKIVAGHEMGIGPMAAMMGINIIQGKVTLSANLLAAQVKANSVYDYLVRDHTAEVCRIEFFQNGDSVGVSEFTMEDATRAGVGGGQNYKKYPKAMLFARALTQGVRWYCPDVTAGSPAYVPEELGAEVDEEGKPTDVEVSEPVTATVTEPAAEEPASDDLDPERVEAILSGFKTLKLTGGEIAHIFGACGAEAQAINREDSILKAIRGLSDEQADAVESELGRRAEAS